MTLTRMPAEPVRIQYLTPVRGLTVKRFVVDGHLVRALPEQFSTVLHLAGSSEWTLGRARWTSRPGSLGAKIPGEVYAERTRRGRGRFQVIVFDDALVADARAALERPQLVGYRPVTARDPQARPLRALHAMIGDAAAEPAALEVAAVEAVHALVELTCAARGARVAPVVGTAAVARARALLDERITEAVGLDELAAHARTDKFHLCRAFRAEIGLPPHAYVTQRRIGLAQRLLARGVGQAEVAAQVGLYDQSQLHRHFKRIVGMTPGAYARAMR